MVEEERGEIVSSLSLEEISEITRMKEAEAVAAFSKYPPFKQALVQLVVPEMLNIGTLFMAFDRADLVKLGNDFTLSLHGFDIKMRPVSRSVELGPLPT